MKPILSRLLLGLFLLLLTLDPGFAVTPLDSYNTLVAGGDDAGFRDGDHDLARFHQPSGLAMDSSGDRLFVADRKNHLIRVVHLRDRNRVETLAGSASVGGQDGPLKAASFDQPTELAWIPGGRLAVLEVGAQRVRILDLQKGLVSTPGKELQEKARLTAWAMAYWAKGDALLFSEPGRSRVLRMDPKTGEATTLLSDPALIPRPKALCLSGDDLYVSDEDSSVVFKADLRVSPPVLSKVGQGHGILEMTWAGGILYALQGRGNHPLVRMTPVYLPVDLGTPWGLLVGAPNSSVLPLLDLTGNVPIGFTSSPQEPRKLFVSFPNDRDHSILSVKDQDFERTWSYSVPGDFTYAPEKPRGTFRILILGDSRVGTAPSFVPEGKGNAKDPEYNLRANTFAKQLQFLLNLESSLKDAGTHFEVLAMGRPGECPLFFANTEVPDMARRFDVDLFLVLTAMGYKEYYLWPPTPEGIPFQEDAEYALKPLSERIPKGVPEDLYRYCVKKGWFVEGKLFPSVYDLFAKEDPEFRKGLMEMMAKPLRVLSAKVRGLKNQEGKPVRWALFHTPWIGPKGRNDDYEAFWVELSRKSGSDLINLDRSFNALKVGFYPAYQACCYHHYTAYGNALVATLLKERLIGDKWVPFLPPMKP